ncbi:hypothetical protein TRVL_04290 [Trypanosoma vivax]|nr:hypothetical protein TRVL_04290 [Trypanosoma vivax]
MRPQVMAPKRQAPRSPPSRAALQHAALWRRHRANALRCLPGGDRPRPRNSDASAEQRDLISCHVTRAGAQQHRSAPQVASACGRARPGRTENTSCRKADPAGAKNQGQARAAGVVRAVSMTYWRNPAFRLAEGWDGAKEWREHKDASIFRHEGGRGHATDTALRRAQKGTGDDRRERARNSFADQRTGAAAPRRSQSRATEDAHGTQASVNRAYCRRNNAYALPPFAPERDGARAG